MADFTPSKKTLQDFNNGVKYVDYDPTTGQNGDEVQAETLNNVIESQMWTQKLAENPIFDNEIGVEGTPSLEIGTMLDGTPRLVAKHLVGKSAIMYNKVLALGSEESPISSLPTSYAFLKADFFALDYLLTDLSSIVNKTFLVSEVAYLTQSGSTVGEKHTYLTLYKITNADFVTIYASVVSRVETTGVKGANGIGIDFIETKPSYIYGDSTVTPLDIVLTDGSHNLFAILAKNGTTPESGLFEIPYDLTNLQSGSAGVDFIIDNIEKIKKGAYFKWLSTTNVVITSVNSDNSTIELVFNAETIRNSDHYIQHNLVINKNNKTVGDYKFDIDGADLENDPQLLIGKWIGNAATFTTSGVKATAANNGKVVGVQNGKFALVDAPSISLYEHNVILGDYIYCTILTNSAVPLNTSAKLAIVLHANGHTSNINAHQASGTYDAGQKGIVIGIYSDSTNIGIVYNNINSTSTTTNSTTISVTIRDKVVPL